jgi:hypothetical protein
MSFQLPSQRESDQVAEGWSFISPQRILVPIPSLINNKPRMQGSTTQCSGSNLVISWKHLRQPVLFHLLHHLIPTQLFKHVHVLPAHLFRVLLLCRVLRVLLQIRRIISLLYQPEELRRRRHCLPLSFSKGQEHRLRSFRASPH